ncbi:MAG: hypothetical protein H0V73_11190, partial [Chloroflexi bacterium]|nr:hypothetical protein [Chloroflexota bacterium]
MSDWSRPVRSGRLKAAPEGPSTTIRAASGAGIGLLLCLQLVESMGSVTWMKPRQGGGVEVGFRLPVVRIDDDIGGA